MIEKEGEDRMGNRCLAVWRMFCGRRRRNLRKIVTKNYSYLLLLLWLHIPLFFLKPFFAVQQICRCTSVGFRGDILLGVEFSLDLVRKAEKAKKC